MTNTHFFTTETLPKNSRILVYGSGKAAGTVLERIRQERPDVIVPCLLNSFHEGEAFGLPVVKSDAVDQLAGTYDVIVIASAWWRDILRDLNGRGITNAAPAALSLWHKYVFSETDMDRMRDRVEAVIAMLSSPRDKALYRFLIDARRENSPLVAMDNISPEIIDYPQVRRNLCGHLTDQYLDFVVLENMKTILHAGVFDGQDCQRFFERCPALTAVHGFEPQGESLIPPQRLRLLNDCGKVHIHPYGLWDTEAILPLTGSGPMAAIAPDAAPPSTTGTVCTLSIDGFVAEKGIAKVDYICLDVEGAESRALAGGQKTIREHRPQLAICIYHQKEDIYTLPLSMGQMLDDYVFHLGHYHHCLNETVLYALPREQAECHRN